MAPPDMVIRDAVSRILIKEFDEFIDKKDIKVSNFVVYIKASPTVKSELYMRKNKILEELRKEIGDNTVLDIR